MLDYRFDSFDADGCLVAVENLKAHNDVAALEAARTLCMAHSLEVWQGARRVLVLNGADARQHLQDA
jgi:hypothetical protein